MDKFDIEENYTNEKSTVIRGLQRIKEGVAINANIIGLWGKYRRLGIQNIFRHKPNLSLSKKYFYKSSKVLEFQF